MKRIIYVTLFLLLCFFTAGDISYCKELARDTEIDGYLFKAGSKVEFYDTGSIKYAWPSEAMEIYGIKCAAGYRADFYEAGGIERATLAEEQEIQQIDFLPKTEINFYESGRIKKVNLVGPQKVQDFEAAGGTVDFYEDGQIQHILLARDFEYVFKGLTLPGMTEIIFNNDGSLDRIKLSRKFNITDELKSAKAYWVLFHPNGQIKKIRLAQKAVINNQTFPKNTVLYFDKYQNIMKADKPVGY
jgi:hypothetical protein